MGSQIQIVSKTGTNSFHGTLFEYHRNDNLDARNFYDYGADDPLDGKRLPPFVRNQFGGSIGGPIVQDQNVFPREFRITAGTPLGEPDIRRAGSRMEGGTVGLFRKSTPPSRVGSTSGPIRTCRGIGFADNPSTTTDQYYGQVRIDHTFSESDTLFGRYTIDDSEKLEPRDLPGVGQLSSRLARST